MPRFFTLEQAQRLLPEVEGQLRKAMEAHQRAEESEREVADLIRRVMVSGGMRLDPAESLLLRGRRNAAANALKEALESIIDLGVQVKDLNIGLIDFPTLYRGQEVLLCWKLGEKGIRFWHGLEEGVRGRKPIGREFLDNHSGDDSH